ncbi:hypothetical protein NFI96_005497 [Prochilodus magdalenae]|nr:hypothetical protein NFI96_005497 [Prochilodus magdalenae]
MKPESCVRDEPQPEPAPTASASSTSTAPAASGTSTVSTAPPTSSSTITGPAPATVATPPGETGVKTIEGVIQRSKLALKSYRRCGSMKRAFEKQNVDRDTIARTAPIAELYIAFPDAFAALPEWNDSVEKMSAYAERCRQAITCDMARQILEMKKKHLLLPTVYKLT